MTAVTEADEISAIAFGFMGSKALFVALDHEIFTHLSNGDADVDDIASKTGLHRDRVETLLTALAGLGLLTVEDGRFANAPGAEAFLVRGAKYDFGDYLRLQVGRQMYGLIHQLGAAISGNMPAGATASYEEWFSDAAEARLYSESQHAGSLGPARQLTRKVDLTGARRLLDVGGGTGAFAITLCQSFPDLTATVVDFPNVSALGRAYAADAGLADRIAFVDGNALAADWPDGQDIVLMSYLLSGVPGDDHARLLERAYAHLAPGGRLLVHDFVVSADRSGPRLAALWQLQHTAFTPEARSLDSDGLGRLLEAAGFVEVEVMEMIPEMTKLAVARRPT
ncbi:Demethylspheroidene O-methyltransferase [Roseivivax jejudonensis]|uniref:Demethylspheroidene O-methyltransferase n=1 Tax=Roseivivax jejudonensis TaxID=1529041 RepID=A0A1X6YS40_9RHOB|nr:methyltransferase [Roseivivax jejudonensis]SLN29485.1 Demethylspheroidene O-methyltransferase [Roseivivax jejudonensis]